MSSLPTIPPPPPPTDPALDPGASSSAGGKKKRAGAPKAKGAVRAKSGCYTCRIRRKKCDERPDADGNCQTCVRLRLECLGFGAKRPDWMRENNSVQELREKIKQFLASQGMIKGHSGGGVRPAAEREPTVLPLSTESHIHAGGPPPGPPPSMPPNGDPNQMRGPGARMPPLRDALDPMVHFLPGGHPFPGPPGQGHPHPPLGPPPPGAMPPPPHHPGMVGAMPVPLDPALAYMPGYGHGPPPPPPPPPGHGPPPHHQQQPPPPPQQPPTPQQPSHMSSIPASPWPSAPPLQPSCSFGASYNINDDYFHEQQVQEEPASSENVHPPAATSSGPPAASSSTGSGSSTTDVVMYRAPRVEDSREYSYVLHYMTHVLKIQYLLADASIERFIFQFAQTSPSARSAMCLLSAVHQQRMRQMGQARGTLEVDNQELDRLLRRTKWLLSHTNEVTEGEAMAGLHVVSCFLFLGGQGPWQHYLNVAMHWVGSILRDRRYVGPLDAYRHCTESEQFIIRTTMWFDVWSAVTRRTEPKFAEIYRELFEGVHGYPGTQIGDVDMLTVMGCTNETVLAMSETACLAHWKEERIKQGNLSMPVLIERGREIELRYLSREHDAALNERAGEQDDLDTRRRLAANVFRTSARVYLHTVLSGCLPEVDEIKLGVDETVRFLRQIPRSEGASRSVVRSVVLSIALCGCMTDIPQYREFLKNCLVSLAGQEVEVLGNCRQAKALMERVWSRRDAGERDVDWRDVIRDMTTSLLLV